MVTILLQQIIDILKEFFGDFIEWANIIGDKIAGIKDDTEDIATSNNAIKANSDDIKDNTAAVITPVNSIKTNSDSIKTDTTTIKNTVGTMSNQLTTISTNVGSTAAFTEDTATNTLNILDKVTTIASDTTQIRAVDNNIYSRLNNMEDLLNWSLYGIDYYMNAVGDNHVTFDTDREYTDLKALSVEIVATQAGSGTPSPSNPRAISGFSSATIVHNGITESIPFGSTIYGGVLDVINGKLTIMHGIIVVDNTKNIIKNSADNNNYLYRLSTPLNNRYENQISDMLEYKEVSVIAENGTDKIGFSQNIRTSDTILYFNLGDLGITNDVASLKTWLGNNPLTVVYELATPTEITLTPVQIEQIFGANTISTNTNGKVYVTYTESLKFYLED